MMIIVYDIDHTHYICIGHLDLANLFFHVAAGDVPGSFALFAFCAKWEMSN